MQDGGTHDILCIHDDGTNGILIKQDRVHMGFCSHRIGHLFLSLIQDDGKHCFLNIHDGTNGIYFHMIVAHMVFYPHKMLVHMVF